MGSGATFALFFGFVGVVLMAVPGGYWPRARATVARMYADDRLPHLLRTAGAMGRVLGPFALCLAALALLPKDVARVGSAGILLAFPFGLVLAYRAPLRLLPGWLRADVQAGRLTRPEPDPWDRFFLVILASTIFAAGLAAAWLAMGF